MLYLGKMAEDKFNVELLPRKQQLQSRTGDSGYGPSFSSRKKKNSTKVCPPAPAKDTVPHSDCAEDVEDGWRVSEEGKWMLKRDVKQIARKQIENL
jgi:hypothetical protein